MAKSTHLGVKICQWINRWMLDAKLSHLSDGLYPSYFFGGPAKTRDWKKGTTMVRNAPVESIKSEPQTAFKLEPNVDLWVNEQLFEEDVRAVLRMMRPNTRERLQGWNEYRTGGAHFRVTVSWDDEFQITAADNGLAVPHMTEVIETLLVGSMRTQDEMDAAEEFEQYRRVIREVHQRLEHRQSCYE